MSLTQLHSAIKQGVDQQLEARVADLPDTASRLKNAMRYALVSGGKRMRPLLVNLIGDMLGVEEIDRDAIAQAIECIHAYSLVHDDLPAMDDDELRRGLPTCHIAFDEATAILAGDALQALAFAILADAPMSEFANARRITLVSTLAKAAGYRGMCGGQALDLATTGTTIDEASLRQLHNMKTGALLAACVSMTASVSAVITPNHTEILLKYAELIGLAFQVQDDILDVEGNTEVIGKPSGSDSAQGKNTFPALMGMEQAKLTLAGLHREALHALQSLPYNTQLLVEFTDLMVQRDH